MSTGSNGRIDSREFFKDIGKFKEEVQERIKRLRRGGRGYGIVYRLTH